MIESDARSASEALSSATSRLGRALVRLNAAMEQVEQREERIERLLSDWDRSWEDRRSEILKWLSAVDAAAETTPVRVPRNLSIVRMPVDADEIVSMLEP